MGRTCERARVRRKEVETLLLPPMHTCERGERNEEVRKRGEKMEEGGKKEIE